MKISLFLLVVMFSSCKNKPYQKPTCSEIDAMMESDQLHRGDYRMSAFFTVADSLARAKYGDKMIDDDIGEFMNQANEITKDRPDSDFIDVVVADSLWALQIAIDNRNIERLLEIFSNSTQEELDQLDCLKNQSLLPFVHAGELYYDKVRKCIDQHKDYIGFNRYRHIRWNLDGREERITEEDFAELVLERCLTD